MEVKDVRGDLPIVGTPGSQTPKPASDNRNNNSSESVSSAALTADEVEITSNYAPAVRNSERSQFNTVISVVNVASEATDSLNKIVNSLDGLAKQAATEDISDSRRLTLQHEANDLVQEIRKAVQVSAPNGTKPLAGDKIRVEVEEKLGKVLEFLLPDHSSDNLGISSVNFTAKESIIKTQTTIEAARRQIEQLRNAVHKIHRDIASAVESSDATHKVKDTSVREVDVALVLAHDTNKDIGSNPRAALNSIGQSSTLNLLD